MADETGAAEERETLVYGVLNDNLVLLPEPVALEEAAELDRIWALRTYGEARALAASGVFVPGMIEDEEDTDPEDRPPDDDPYDPGRFEIEDWPPLVATIALANLPEDLDDIGEQVEHFPHTETLEIDPATESELVTELRRRGHQVRRDDSLVERINPYA